MMKIHWMLLHVCQRIESKCLKRKEECVCLCVCACVLENVVTKGGHAVIIKPQCRITVSILCHTKIQKRHGVTEHCNNKKKRRQDREIKIKRKKKENDKGIKIPSKTFRNRYTIRTRRIDHFGAVIHFLFSKKKNFFFVIIPKEFTLNPILFILRFIQLISLCYADKGKSSFDQNSLQNFCYFIRYDFVKFVVCSKEKSIRKMLENGEFCVLFKANSHLCVVKSVSFNEWCACFEPQFFKKDSNVFTKKKKWQLIN